MQSRQGRKVISIKASSTTKDLYERAAIEFGGDSHEIESIKGGFPPKLIPRDDDLQLSSLLSNNERLQVEFLDVAVGASANKAAKEKAPTCKTEDDTNDNPVNSRKSKRAASKAATEAMPALIKAQDEYTRLQQKQPSKKRSRPVTSNMNVSPPKRSTKPKSSKISSSSGVGRRLADGATVGNPRPSSLSSSAAAAAGRRAAKAASRNGSSNTANSDLSEALLGALHDRGQMGVVLRKGMKNAVQASYETTKSFSRLAAIQAKSFRMTTLDENTTLAGSQSSSNGGSHLKVVYHGSVDKSKVEEIVDCIPLDVLQSVMEGIYASDKEALRPENLARLSPRVLWSCVYHSSTETNILDMYHRLLPNLDWSFLRRRSAQLSEKAMENKRQEEEMERIRNGVATEIDLEGASNAVAAVEHAMEYLHDYQAEERKARSAQAAMARMQRLQEQKSDEAPWTLTTPCEPDRDELRECVEASPPSNTSPSIVSKWITQLMKDCKIHNWRELANVSNASSIATLLGVPEENVQAWIDHAQSESVAEIIVEICDGNVEAVESLTEGARSGTPKDLAAWRSIPEVLLGQIRLEPQGNDTLYPTWMDLETITRWCNRAHIVLQAVDWLNWYATPVA